MENPQIKKNLINIFVVFCVWIGAIIVILSCMNAIIIADIPRGIYPDVGDYIGRGMAITAGLVFPGAGIFFIIASLTAGVKKPELVKVFGIIIFVLVMGTMGFMAIGAVAAGSGLAEVVACANDPGNSAATRLHCQGDIGYNIVIIICMIAMAGIAVIGIIGCVKIVTIMNGALPSAGFVSTPTTVSTISQQPAAVAAGSQGKFCSACGAANADDAKFCKKCGKAC
jgi:ribosomal protein L40E